MTYAHAALKLDNEPVLKYSILVAMDGNESLKRHWRQDERVVDGQKVVRSIERPDNQTRPSMLYIDPAIVEGFKNEVRPVSGRVRAHLALCIDFAHQNLHADTNPDCEPQPFG